MAVLAKRSTAKALTTISALRAELRAASTPRKALDVVTRAARAKRIFEAIGRSVEECNEYAEIYLAAYWRFGDLVTGIERGRPQKTRIDTGFPGTEEQRRYARRLCEAISETDIPEYVRVATEQLEPASIAGCLDWIAPGAHVGQNSGNNEWYTPREYIDAARAMSRAATSCRSAPFKPRLAELSAEVDAVLKAFRAHEKEARASTP